MQSLQLPRLIMTIEALADLQTEESERSRCCRGPGAMRADYQNGRTQLAHPRRQSRSFHMAQASTAPMSKGTAGPSGWRFGEPPLPHFMPFR